ncbi:MAG: ribonuclease H family protein [Gemmatimonadaceae bacterium]
MFADESCLGNGREGQNPGGAAGLIEYPVSRGKEGEGEGEGEGGGSMVRLDYWLSEPAATNNRMALRSAIEAMRILSRKGNRLRVRFTSDSQYLVKGMSEWIRGWKARGWKRREGEIENLLLWKELADVADAHVVDWQWVRGHNKHAQNEYADHLATRAAREQSNSNGPVPSLYDEWLADQRARGKLPAAPLTGGNS